MIAGGSNRSGLYFCGANGLWLGFLLSYSLYLRLGLHLPQPKFRILFFILQKSRVPWILSPENKD